MNSTHENEQPEQMKSEVSVDDAIKLAELRHKLSMRRIMLVGGIILIGIALITGQTDYIKLIIDSLAQ